jgi:hypothetical protein
MRSFPRVSRQTFRPTLRKLRKVRKIVDMVAGGAVLEQWVAESRSRPGVAVEACRAGESAEVAR